jgi:hypothetical protein
MSNGGGRQRETINDEHGGIPEFDSSTPNIARIYDYYLGGRDNYPADREAARRVLGATPDVLLAAHASWPARTCGRSSTSPVRWRC